MAEGPGDLGSSQDHAPGAGAVRVEAHPERGFSRTLATANDADSMAALLSRAAGRVAGFDGERLRALGRRYADYAAALRETVAATQPADDAEQLTLLSGGALGRHDAAPDAASGRTPKAGG